MVKWIMSKRQQTPLLKQPIILCIFYALFLVSVFVICDNNIVTNSFSKKMQIKYKREKIDWLIDYLFVFCGLICVESETDRLLWWEWEMDPGISWRFETLNQICFFSILLHSLIPSFKCSISIRRRFLIYNKWKQSMNESMNQSFMLIDYINQFFGYILLIICTEIRWWTPRASFW
jgi:hypothetical protein